MTTEDPRLFAARYDIPTAARCVRMPVSTLRVWAYGAEGCKPILDLPEKRFLSFVNLTEVFVLHALRKHHRILMPNIRKALKYVERELAVKHPLAFEPFETNGIDLFVKKGLQYVNVSKEGQIALNDVHEAFQRIEWQNHRPVALFPIMRLGQDSCSRNIKISPKIAFGKPVIANTAIPVTAVFSRFNAGESIRELARDFDLSEHIVEEAVRAELAFAA